MQTFNVRIRPLSPGSHGSHGELTAGTGKYATTPNEPRDVTLPITAFQMTGLQGYLVLIKAGFDTSTIETAITAVGPT